MLKDRIWELVSKQLSGEASAGELQELGDLLKNAPDMHYSMQAVADLWHQKNDDDEADAYDAFNRHVSRMRDLGVAVYENENNVAEPVTGSGSPAKKILLNYFLPAFFILLLVGTGIYYFHNMYGVDTNATVRQVAEKSEVSTKYGSKTKLVLPDGTQVWLNSGTKLSYTKAYGNRLREVSLSGEAYFDVVKNPERPFVIHTSKINIKVLGTAFNVKSYPGEKKTETSLVRGSIEVTFNSRPSEKIILKPNEKLIVSNEEEPEPVKPAKNNLIPNIVVHQQEPIIAISHLTYEPKDSTVIETSWMENKLIFRSESFEDLALRMERWYGISIRFGDEAVKKKKLNGTFENENIEQALQALQLIVPFKYIINKKEILIQRKE